MSDELVEQLMDVIEPHLRQLERQGHLTTACQYHGAEFIEDINGERLCTECLAEDGSGELCHVGLDSVSAEIAKSMIKHFYIKRETQGAKS